jgi:hypothetical protein
MNLEGIGVRMGMDSSGFVQGAMASQSALARLSAAVAGTEQTVGTVDTSFDKAVSSVKTFAAALVGAFTVKKTLTDFAASDLPGAGAFRVATEKMRLSVLRLSESVGEFFSPAAILFTKSLDWIAQKLEPLVRRISALKMSATDFMVQLGKNFFTALRPLMPAVAGFFDKIFAFFDQQADWDARFKAIQDAWNNAWAGIAKVTAPVVVALAKVGDALVDIVGRGIAWVRDKLDGLFGPQQHAKIHGFATFLSDAIVGGLSVIEAALTNPRLSFDILRVSGGIAIEFLKNNWLELLAYVGESIVVAAKNIVTVFSNLSTQLTPVFQALGTNIANILSESMGGVFDSVNNRFTQWRAKGGRAVLDFFGIGQGPATIGFGLARVTDEELERQFPTKIKSPAVGNMNLQPIPSVDWKEIVKGVTAMPQLKGLQVSPEQKVMMDQLKILTGQFGGLAQAAFANNQKQAQAFLDALGQNLPNVNGVPGARIERPDLVGALLYGTSKAFAAENNMDTKNPLVELQKQNNSMTADQLVEARAARAAAERQARIANF